MGFFSELFKPRAVEAKQTTTRHLFDIKRALSGAERRSQELTVKRDKLWADARGYMEKGQKMLARKKLLEFQRQDCMIAALERQISVTEFQVNKIELAKTGEELAKALGALQKSMHIDSNAVAEAFEQANTSMAEIEAIDQYYSNAQDEMDWNSSQLPGAMSIDEMMESLEQEAGISVSGKAPNANDKNRIATTVKVESDALSRIADQLNRKK